MASPIIHRRMASVNIVQNTALLLLSWWSPQKSFSSLYCYVARKTSSVMGFDSARRSPASEKNLLTVSDPKKSPTGCLDLSSKEAFCASDPAGDYWSL